MNPIEVLKTIIYETGLITGEINTDIAQNNAGDFSLYSTGESTPKKFINGDVEYTHNFIFYSHQNADTEQKRNENIEFNKELCDDLNACKGRVLTENTDVIGVVKSVTAQNGMLFNIPGSLYGGFTYQIQIKLTYKIFHKKERNK